MDSAQAQGVLTVHGLDRAQRGVLAGELRSSRPRVSLVVPTMPRDLEGDGVRKLLDGASRAGYLTEVLVVLGAGTDEKLAKAEARRASAQPPGMEYRVAWADDPRITAILEEEGQGELAKSWGTIAAQGRDAWFGLGLALGIGLERPVEEEIPPDPEFVAIMEPDIQPFSFPHGELLARLIAPAYFARTYGGLELDLVRGYYSRHSRRGLHGRLSRLLVPPMLEAMERLAGHSPLLNFLRSWRYSLAGEALFSRRFVLEGSFPADWSFMIGTLTEAHRLPPAGDPVEAGRPRPWKVAQSDLLPDHGLDHAHVDLEELASRANGVAGALIASLWDARPISSTGIGLQDLAAELPEVYEKAAHYWAKAYLVDMALNNVLPDNPDDELRVIQTFREQVQKAVIATLEGWRPYRLPRWKQIPPAVLIRFRKAMDELVESSSTS